MRLSPTSFALGFVAACASSQGSTTATATTQSGSAPGDAVPRSFVSRVAAVGTSGTQLFGTVRLTPTSTAGEYSVAIDLRGAKLGNRIPWAIATGQCSEPSSTELGDRVQYRVLQASADGTAQMKGSVRVALNERSVYHVSFFASPTERDRVVSCGPLVPE